MKTCGRLALAVVIATLAASLAHADDILYLRPLPTSGVNDFTYPPGPSNAAYSPQENGFPATNIFAGDFTLDVPLYLTGISVWAVGYTPLASEIAANTPIAPEWNAGDLHLWWADAGHSSYPIDLSELAPGWVSIERDSYVSAVQGGGLNYESNFAGGNGYPSTFGNYYALWRITFGGLNLVTTAGNDYEFAVSADGQTATKLFQLHMTGCGISQDTGEYDAGFCNGVGTILMEPNMSGSFSPNLHEVGGAGNYDFNIALIGVPEPTTLLLIGAGLGLIGLVRRRL
jgi:hypothetical protein